MTTVELAQMVKRVRELQRSYFRSRNQSVLQESKDAEKKLDAAVEAVLHPKAPPQPGLFDEPAPPGPVGHDSLGAFVAWCPACKSRCFVLFSKCRGCGARAEPLNGR